VNTASAAGLSAGPTPAYRASKWGVVGLTRFAAREVAGRGIRNNAVCPGVIMTPMVERLPRRPAWSNAGALPSRSGVCALPRPSPTLVVWLCSETASFVTGIALPVDGGLLA